MAYRVAVASTDGIVVNQHFGHADRFHIVELNPEDGTHHFVESRDVQHVCQGHGHDDAAFDSGLETLSDVQVILVAKIGQGASDYLERRGLLVYEAPFLIEPVFEKIIKDRLWEVDSWRSHTRS